MDCRRNHCRCIIWHMDIELKNMKRITRDKWVWMGHPAHFICAQDCKFFMATRIGKYIVSTVGEYFPDAPIREIYAQSRGIVLKEIGDERRYDYMKRVGFEEIGCGRKYETMVFEAKKVPKTDKYKCCPWRITSSDVDFNGYNTAGDAFKGHYKMCDKWSKR